MFSERLKKLRNEKRLSQKELAKELKMSQQTIAKWENNQSTPNPEMIVKIADFFDISTDYLLGRTNEDISIDKIPKQKIRNFNYNRLQELVKNKDSSLEELAELLHTNKYEIAMYLSGIKCPQEKDLYSLSEYFNHPIELEESDFIKSDKKNLIKQIEIPKGKTYIIINEEEKELIESILKMLRKKE